MFKLSCALHILWPTLVAARSHAQGLVVAQHQTTMALVASALLQMSADPAAAIRAVVATAPWRALPGAAPLQLLQADPSAHMVCQ
jgi:hypothetical protein